MSQMTASLWERTYWDTSGRNIHRLTYETTLVGTAQDVVALQNP